MGKRLQKYKDRCSDFWGACLFAGEVRTPENQNDITPKRKAKGLLVLALWLLIVIGIVYFAVLAGRHLWIRIVQPLWVEERAS